MHYYAELIIRFAVVLGIMVLVHELGHFLAAKWCGVRVETFSIGFGPRLLGFRRGDTDYRLSLLPLGGYVKMSGDVPGEAPSGDPGEFNAHPRWQRMLIAFGGPLANFIFSFLLLIVVGLYHHTVAVYLDGAAVVDYVPVNSAAAHIGLAPGDTITRFYNDANPTWNTIINDCELNKGRSVALSFSHAGHSTDSSISCAIDENFQIIDEALLPIGLIPRLQTEPLGVDSVSDNTPAARAGLRAGDKILSVDTFEPHSARPALVGYLQDRKGAPENITVLRNGQTLHLTITPEKMPTEKGEMGYRLGFANHPAPTRVTRLSFPAAVHQSVKDNVEDSTLILRILQGLFTRHVSVKALSGPVGIAQQIQLAAENGTWTLIRFMSSISLNLGIFNLLPIPILDGGMIVFLFIESAMRRDLNQQIKERVYQVAFVCLIMFAVFVFYNDLTRGH